jgi:hypothetical protein
LKIFKFILTSIILLIASFNVNAETIEEHNARANAINNSIHQRQLSGRTPVDDWLDKRVAEMKDEKALKLQQQEQQLRIQEQQLRIQQQQRYMNQ